MRQLATGATTPKRMSLYEEFKIIGKAIKKVWEKRLGKPLNSNP